jgi:uncharacterized protein
MPRQSPIPEEVDKPFWAACNEDRLVLQFCERCKRYQHPPEPTCSECTSSEHLVWRDNDGDGHIYTYAVVYDTPVKALMDDLPYAVAVIQLDNAEGINFLSHLPGTSVDEVPIGAAVKVSFESTPATGQKVPEWRVTP